MLPASWNFDTLYNGFRSFNDRNMGSVGQRAAKLLAIKLWEWFDPGTTRTRAEWYECSRGRMHTDWFQEFFSNNSLFWRYNLELSNSRFVWPYIYSKSPRNFRKPHGKFSEPFYIENTKFHFNIMTEISTFFGPDFLSHWIPLNFCLKYLCNWQLMYVRAKILA